MAYFMIAQCGRCKCTFHSNPDLVPVERLDWKNAAGVLVKTTREPLCASCVVGFRRELIALGQTPPEVHPGAYAPASEPTDRAKSTDLEGEGM